MLYGLGNDTVNVNDLDEKILSATAFGLHISFSVTRSHIRNIIIGILHCKCETIV